MTDKPARPVLRLKTAPPPSRPPSRWRCKPCGGVVVLTGREADTDVIRCPACNARLGVAAKFYGDPAEVARVRARPDAGPIPAAPSGPAAPFQREIRRPTGSRRPVRPD